MPISIYNSLTRKKEEFIPLKPPVVNIYTCGVTVYDQSHIGHARSLYTFDTIRKYLKYRGFEVKFVRNLTDIDDKIINRANELKVNWQDLIKKYIDCYYEDLKSLGVAKGDFEPRATENIPDMIKYIEGLIEKDYAYESGGDVYFNVRKFSGYGKLSGQSIDEMQKGTKSNPGDLKKDSLDFALWKKSKENEPFWESPWGKGRPGWHLECSVMSQKFLKTDTLDIHAGGLDLIFPHHENEIAQAEALTGKQFAKYWLHHGLLTINGQKMSKSLCNFVTIKDYIDKYQSTNFLKLFFLSAHYSHPIDFTGEKINEAKVALERIIICLNKISPDSRNNLNEDGKNGKVEDFRGKFIEAMDDDFNTPQALAVIFELVTLINKNMGDIEFISPAAKAIKEMLLIFGISTEAVKVEEAFSDKEISEMISQRNKARLEKNFTLSDKIRKELEDKGVILEDTKDGKTTWRIKL